MAKSKEQVVRTTVWSAGAGCHGGCGVKLYVKDGKLVRVEGDENHPWSQGRECPRVLALTQYIDHPDRIRFPLKRVGERGEGKWQRIAWDEAYNIVEHKLKDIREKFGAESVIFVQGTGRDIGGPITLLMYSYGSPNWTQLGLVGHSCYTPRMVAMWTTHGDYCVADCSQFLEKRYEDPEWKVPKCIVVWAQNPAAGDPDGFYGHWIVDCMKRGSELIVIDPRVNWIASRARIHLQIRPSTDGALALAMANVIINEGLYDKEFVANWTYGFEELKKRVQQYTPEWAEPITWVPKEKIIEAARFYATSKPAAIHWGIPIDACPQGTVVSQAITQLWCLTGNIDNPGGNVICRPSHGVTSYPYTQDEMKKLYGEELFQKLSDKRIGADRYPMIKNFRAWASEDVILEQMESGQPYPIRAAWIQTNNVLESAADPKRHYEALKKLDFVACVDLFHTPTTEAVADIILPAATFAEKDSIRSWWSPLCCTVKAVEIGECKSDWEMNFELARRLSTKPWKYNTLKDLFDDRLKVANTTFDELAAKGSWEATPPGPSRPYYRWKRGLLRKDGKPGFNTTTGKIEFYAKLQEEWGLDPLPYYEEPEEGPISSPELWQKYPLINNSGHRIQAYFHSEHRQIPWLRELEPYPTFEISPETARKHNVSDGEWVYLENQRGRVKYKARVVPGILHDVIAPTHSWWLPETDGKAPNFFGVFQYNINTLIPACTQGRSGWGGAGYKRFLCRIVKIEGQKE